MKAKTINPKNVKMKANGTHPKTNGVDSKHPKPNGVHSDDHLLHLYEEPTLTDSELLKILVQVRSGNFSVRLPSGQSGMKRSICETLNDIIELNERMVF